MSLSMPEHCPSSSRRRRIRSNGQDGEDNFRTKSVLSFPNRTGSKLTHWHAVRGQLIACTMLLSIMVCVVTVEPAQAEEKPVYLLFTNRQDIRLINSENPRANASIFSSHLEVAAAVDFYYADELIFWTDIGLEMIRGLKLNGSKKNVFNVVTTGILSPDGLACDWLTKKIYWTDSDTNKIEVIQFDGKNRKVLFWKDLDQPRAIVLVPQKGYMFWSDWGALSKIERASMDGSQTSRKVIVSKNIMWPNGLTVDYEPERIYWADAKLEFIVSMDFDGNNRRTVVTGNLPHPFALTLSGDQLFWTDWSSHSISVCNKNTGQKRKTIIPGELLPMDIHAYSAERQPHHPTACDVHNAGCSHLCLLSDNVTGYSCACPTGILLLHDGKTCAEKAEKFLLIARRVDIRRISLDTEDYADVVLPLKGIKHGIAIDYDVVDDRVYWTDDEARVIRRAFVNGTNQEDLISTEVHHPDGVAVDWVARNLYWTDTGTDRIEVTRLNGTSRKILVTEGLDEPRTIAVYPDAGLMFWTDWGAKAKIERAALDGTMRQVIINSSLGWPNGLAIDYSTEHIYWCDAKIDRIEMANLNGQERRELVKEQIPHTFGFSILDDFVYWTDWQRRSVERVHKITGDQREVIIDQLPDLMGLKAVDRRYIQGDNPCAVTNGHCSHLCLNKPDKKYVCACPTGYELGADNQSCVVSEAFVLLARRQNVKRITQQSRRTACKVNNGGCSHICQVQSAEGSNRKCSCPLGLMLSNDDKTCVNPPTCSPDQFACHSGKINCIPENWRCDGIPECDDKSDELHCPECPLPNYRCPRNGACLEPSSLCDGYADCPDGVDEACCASDEFACGTPHKGCIQLFQVCDGKKDCKDGYDEVADSCIRKDIKGNSMEINNIEPPQNTYTIVVVGALAFVVVIGIFAYITKRKVLHYDDGDLGVNDVLMGSTRPLSGQSSERVRSNMFLNKDSTVGRRAPVGPGSSTCPAQRSESEQLFYDRNNVTGASSTSSSSAMNPYPKAISNPPPSPATDRSQEYERSLYDTSCSHSRSSGGNQWGTGSRRPSFPTKSYNKRANLLNGARGGGPHPTPCSTDFNEDSDTYSYANYYTNSHTELSSTYDTHPRYDPPPPTPHCLSDCSTPPSPCTERSFCNPLPPPPSPVARDSDNEAA